MSNRTLLSRPRPRTRIYDLNYNIGQNYYKPAIDRLDEKYCGNRKSSPLRQSSLPKDLLPERHTLPPIFDKSTEQLEASRKRVEKLMKEDVFFDSRGAPLSLDGIDEETSAKLKRIRTANRNIATLEDNSDMVSTVNCLTSQRMLDRSDKALRSFGLDEQGRRALEDEVTHKRRALRMTQEQETQNDELTKWSALDDPNRGDAAALRAKKSRERLRDLEDEMMALEEKQQARERRAARLRALVAENAQQQQGNGSLDEHCTSSAVKSVKFQVRRERKTVAAE